jgi:hypothetical protein
LFPAKLGATDDVGSSFGISLLSGSYHVLLSDATCAFLWTSSRCINLFYQNIKIKIGTTCILIQWPIEFFFFFLSSSFVKKIFDKLRCWTIYQKALNSNALAFKNMSPGAYGYMYASVRPSVLKN